MNDEQWTVTVTDSGEPEPVPFHLHLQALKAYDREKARADRWFGRCIGIILGLAILGALGYFGLLPT